MIDTKYTKFRTIETLGAEKKLGRSASVSFKDPAHINIPILDGEEWTLSEAIDKWGVRSADPKDREEDHF